MPAIQMLDGFAPPSFTNDEQISWATARATAGQPILNGEQFFDVELGLPVVNTPAGWKPLRSDIDLQGAYILNTLPVEHGGTGGTDQASALSGLGAAAAAHTHVAEDVTDLGPDLYTVTAGTNVTVVLDEDLKTATISSTGGAELPIDSPDVAVDTTGLIYLGDGTGDITDLDTLVADLNEKIGFRVPYGAYDVHTVIIANEEDTPIPLTLNAGTVLGRGSSGDITALPVSVHPTSGNISLPTVVYNNTTGLFDNGAINSGPVFVKVGTNVAPVSITKDPTGRAGTMFEFEYNFTAPYDGDSPTTGPQVMGGLRGPRAAFMFTGVGYWPNNMKVYSPEPMAFVDMHTERLPASATGDRTAQFSWSFVSVRYRIADGHKWTVLNNDTRNGPCPYFDNQVWVSGNGGQIEGTTGVPAYPAGTGYSEIDNDTGRWISSFSGALHFYGNVRFTGYAMFAGHDVFTEFNNPAGPSFIEAGEAGISGAITIDAQTQKPFVTLTTFYSPWMEGGDRNQSAIFNSPMSMYERSRTYTEAPRPIIQIGVGVVAATHTLNYANPNITAFQLGGTWRFQQAASAIGAFAAMVLRPTITNTSSLTGEIIPLGVFINASPLYSFNTTNGDVTLTDLRTYYSRAEFTRTGSANQLIVGAHSSFQSGMLINADVEVLQRQAMYVEDATGDGLLTSQIGLRIGPLTKGTFNHGIVNESDSLLFGGVYGSNLANGNIVIGGTTHATTTGSYISLVHKAVASSGLFGSIAANGNLDIGGTLNATHTTSVITMLDQVNLNGSLYANRTRPTYIAAFEQHRYDVMHEEFYGTGLTTGIIGEHGWELLTANGGTIAILGGGVYAIGTGTTTPSGPTGTLIKNQLIAEIGVDFDYEWGVVLPNLSTAAQEYDFWVGWGNSTTVAEPTAGYWFKYDRNTSVNWICVTGNGDGTPTSTTTSVAISGGAFARLRCERVGSTVKFYIDDVEVASHTTDLPDILADTYNPMAGIDKTAGITARTARLDYYNHVRKTVR